LIDAKRLRFSLATETNRSTQILVGEQKQFLIGKAFLLVNSQFTIYHLPIDNFCLYLQKFAWVFRVRCLKEIGKVLVQTKRIEF
jgi:hypothetical protein